MKPTSIMGKIEPQFKERDYLTRGTLSLSMLLSPGFLYLPLGVCWPRPGRPSPVRACADMVLVYFVYGLAFFSMGFAVALEARQSSGFRMANSPVSYTHLRAHETRHA